MIRPRGVKHSSPGWVWHVGQGRCRQPPAKCSSLMAGRVLRNVRSRQRRSRPGQARRAQLLQPQPAVGHQSILPASSTPPAGPPLRRSAARWAQLHHRARRVTGRGNSRGGLAGRGAGRHRRSSVEVAIHDWGWKHYQTPPPPEQRQHDDHRRARALASRAAAKPSTGKLAFRPDAAGAFCGPAAFRVVGG